MGRPLAALTGNRYGKLTVISYIGGDKYSNPLWLCKCDCGKVKQIRGSSLRNGLALSCGCSRSGNSCALKHGHSNSSTYNIWNSMKDRCLNVNDNAYNLYGGRGIKVCDRWLKFENFFSDMGERPEGLTLERINNNGNYEPTNCKWASYLEQNHNSKNRCLLSFEETKRLYKNFKIEGY